MSQSVLLQVALPHGSPSASADNNAPSLLALVITCLGMRVLPKRLGEDSSGQARDGEFSVKAASSEPGDSHSAVRVSVA